MPRHQKDSSSDPVNIDAYYIDNRRYVEFVAATENPNTGRCDGPNSHVSPAWVPRRFDTLHPRAKPKQRGNVVNEKCVSFGPSQYIDIVGESSDSIVMRTQLILLAMACVYVVLMKE